MNPKERKNLVASSMRHKSITLLLVGVMMVAGIFSLIHIPKDEFPQIHIPIGLVVGVYPGASELEVEQQLVEPLEDFLWTFKEIDRKKTTTMSMNDACAAVVWLNRDVKSPTEFWNKLKERLPLLKLTLPPGVLGLVANDDFGEASSILLTLESKDKTYREMAEYVDRLSDHLRTVPSLANIISMGEQAEQIAVYLDRDMLSMYGINTALILSTLSGQAGTSYTGNVADGTLSRSIHIHSSMNTENDVAQTIVSNGSSGGVVRLGDIADVKREYPKPSRYIKNNDNKCILLSLQMKEGMNIMDFGDDVKAIINDFQKTLPDDVKVNIISDQSHVVEHSIKEFLLEMIIAICSVIIVVMLMLPMRVAGVAVMTIPITIFASIALFLVLGVEINSVTLAALIVSLGMIVDDSVVVVDCYLDKLDAGMSRWQAAIQSSSEFVKSIVTATLIISIIFFPLIYTTDALVSSFLRWFPYSITIILVVSLLVAIFVVPILQHRFINKGLKQLEEEKQKHDKKKHFNMLNVGQQAYDKLIELCFRHQRITVACSVLTILLGGFLLSLVPQRLMPRAERNQFAVDIILPRGTDISYTAQIADSLANIMRKDKRVKNLTVFYGSGSPRFNVMFIPNLGGPHFAQFIVNTHDDAEAQGMLDDYAEKYANYFSEAQVQFRQLEYSDHPYPVEVKVMGDNLDSLHVATDSIFRRLSQNKKVIGLSTSWGAINNRLEVYMDPERSNHYGISKSQLSLNFALRFSGGIPITSIWENEYEIPVVIRDANEDRQSIDALKDIRVTGLIPNVTATPLSQVASIKPGWGDGAISHLNGVRIANVFGFTARGTRIGKLNKEIFQDLKTLKLPEGITLMEGGLAEMEKTYRPQIYLGVGIAAVFIFFILVFHLQSIPLSLLIMYSLGFSLVGGALGMLIFNCEFSCTAVLGFISLMGIIARCGIIMVDYAEELREKEGYSIPVAALESAKRRFRPVFLTSAAASMGVVSMVIKNSPLWGPMGVVICVGALVSMFFICTMIPVGYSVIRTHFNKDTYDEED